MKLTSALCATAAVLLLAGCYHYPYAYTTPAVAVAAPAPVIATGPAVVATGPAVVAPDVAAIPSDTGTIVATTEPAATTVFYDQFYGPIVTGYWGTDNMFHYRLVANGPWLIDRARHFRRNAASGFTVVTLAPVAIPPG
jgi:hypothetical protein